MSDARYCTQCHTHVERTCPIDDSPDGRVPCVPIRDLAEDLRICYAASPGPWEIDYDDLDEFHYLRGPDRWLNVMISRQSDARFIAEAREGWPEAIRRAQEAEASAAFMRGAFSLERKRRELLRKQLAEKSAEIARLSVENDRMKSFLIRLSNEEPCGDNFDRESYKFAIEQAQSILTELSGGGSDGE